MAGEIWSDPREPLVPAHGGRRPSQTSISHPPQSPRVILPTFIGTNTGSRAHPGSRAAVGGLTPSHRWREAGCQKSPSRSLLPSITAQTGPTNPPESPSPAEALTQISSLSLPPAQQAPCWACPGAECAAPSAAPRAAAGPWAPPGTGLGARTRHPPGHAGVVPPIATR